MDISSTMNCFSMASCAHSPSSKSATGRFQTNSPVNTYPPQKKNRFIMKHLSSVSGPTSHILCENQISETGIKDKSCCPVPLTCGLIPHLREHGTGRKASSDRAQRVTHRENLPVTYTGHEVAGSRCVFTTAGFIHSKRYSRDLNRQII